MKFLAVAICIVFASHAYAGCTRTATGRTVCENGQEAGGYNARTGKAWSSEKNQNGVATSHTSNGGEAKTKNGKGVYRSPTGKTCAKTASNQGCN